MQNGLSFHPGVGGTFGNTGEALVNGATPVVDHGRGSDGGFNIPSARVPFAGVYMILCLVFDPELLWRQSRQFTQSLPIGRVQRGFISIVEHLVLDSGLGGHIMKTPLTIILTAVALLVFSTLAIMNGACKSGRHGWCAPMSALPSDIKLEPPAQYNHPYDGRVVERIMPMPEVRALCSSRGASPRSVACSWMSDGTCYIVLPNDEHTPVSTYRRHETAHCNGWPTNHPRG